MAFFFQETYMSINMCDTYVTSGNVNINKSIWLSKAQMHNVKSIFHKFVKIFLKSFHGN